MKRKQLLSIFSMVMLMVVMTTATVLAATVMTTMRIDREVKAGADECYRTVTNITAGETVKLLGRNESGSWVFIWADVGDGWVPASSVNVSSDEVATLDVWTDHFDGEACQTQPPQFDSRICGRAGDATSANTTRWTDIYSTADADFDSGRAYPPQTALTLVGRDFWGCWVRVRSTTEAGNGWVPIQALDVRGVLGLPVLVDNSGGCEIINGQVVNCDGDEDDGVSFNVRTVRADTPIYSEPSTTASTTRTVPANGRIKIVSEREGWFGITSRYGNGWIQKGTLNEGDVSDAQAVTRSDAPLHSQPDTDFATGVTIPVGSNVRIVGFATGWLQVNSEFGNGWIPANTVARVSP